MSGYRIHVTNIPISITGPELNALFIPFGNIIQIKPSEKLTRYFKTGKGKDLDDNSTTFADIDFDELEDAIEARNNMNGFEIYGKFLIVTGRNLDNQDQNSKDHGILSGLKDKRAIWDEDNKGILDIDTDGTPE
ncbi:hypothetical protein DASC09_027650 [Saccharomycopsis crataegensis]|uniref:RRM domain-containing protein n=1 Tax=Saccharomycopsis crataegensis TaxID=43959 RepID=A0AAV5QKC9_9ASCO|nr:hypothetical protein DASC09_027650 [Saccharomycopsis crataegensis]